MGGCAVLHRYTSLLRTRQKALFHHLGNHLGAKSKSLLELDLTESVALLFGNERLGITEQSLAYADGNFVIPQVGMTESLNISVACAVSVYEAFRQRKLKGFYNDEPLMSTAAQKELLTVYRERAALKDIRSGWSGRSEGVREM